MTSIARRVSPLSAVFAAIAIGFLGPAASLWAGRFSYLDHPCDPYYVSRTFPKLTTPQWFGEEGVDCVVVLAIDDMRDPAKYEAFLRPILDRLKAIDGRAGVSIMANEVNPKDPQLQQWLQEGVSLEVHTIDHPCPLLQGGDFAKSKGTVDRCIDLMHSIPANRPVAFRMPCCDSLNTPSPRFWTEIFGRTTPAGNYLSIDTSVFQLFTPADTTLPKSLTTDVDGNARFRKYLPFPSFVNTIEDYPYPYMIGDSCWEFPCMVPSDWEAQNILQPMNPKLVEDWQAMLDAAVQKQGVVNVVFHPHGWVRSEQVVQWIDYAVSTYGKRVKFVSFREALQRLNEHLLEGNPIRGIDGAASGVRLIDLNADAYLDVVIPHADGTVTTRTWHSPTHEWHSYKQTLALRRPRFADLGPDSPPVMVDLLATEKPWQQFAWRGSRWEVMPWKLAVGSLSKPWNNLANQIPQLDGFRFHDIDHDGVDEWLLGRGDDHVILQWVPAQQSWHPLPFALPHTTDLMTATDGDAGLRFVDLNHDRRDDIVFSNGKSFSVHLFDSLATGWSRTTLQGLHGTAAETTTPLPMIVRPDGTNNGAWFHSGTLWVQNEDTNRLPDLVDRVSFRKLARPPSVAAESTEFPPPLEPAEAVARFETAPGVRVELVVAEPLVEDPVAFDWGFHGELWVVEMRDYPLGLDGQGKPGGRVKRITDTNGDGQYDSATIFLDDIPYPNGIQAWDKGVLVSAAPDVFYAEDRDGDGKAEQRKTLFTGFTEGNQQHRANGMRWGLDGWLYMANGDSGGEIESVATGKQLSLRGHDLKIRPQDGAMALVAGQTQFGRDRDDAGNWFGGNNSTPMWHYYLDNDYLERNPSYAATSLVQEVPEQHGAAEVFPASPLLPRFNDFDRANRFTSACSPFIYRDNKLGDGTEIDGFVCEPVHNLVSRLRITRVGASFVGRRVPEEKNAEFLASQDNWFRPVMARTGPDGAIWVADMYRLIIEHPEWIPRTWQEKFDLRAGTDRGRIYRIVPERLHAPQVSPALGHLSTKELVAKLDHDNGWQRDAVQHLLTLRADKAAITPLREVLRGARTRWGALHALYLLAELKGLSNDDLQTAIISGTIDVARHAMRFAERTDVPDQAVVDAILARYQRDKADLMLVQQVAYTMGSINDPRGASILAEIIVRHWNEYPVRAAALSSLTKGNAADVLRMAKSLRKDRHEAGEYLPTLHGLVAALGSDEEILSISVALLDEREQYTAEQAAMCVAEIARTLARTGRTDIWSNPQMADRLQREAERAHKVAMDGTGSAPERIQAIEELGLPMFRTAERFRELSTLLGPQESPQIQQAIVEALATLPGETTAEQLLSGWNSHSPRLRDTILDMVMADGFMSRRFLQEIAAGRIESRSITTRARQQLLRHRDPEIREIAARELGETTNADRTRIVEQYLSALQLKSDPQQGKGVFQQRCATCHEFDGVGKSIGPDLNALTDKSGGSLLTAVLDPNRAVEDRYLEYLIELQDGRQISGLLIAESSTGVTLAAADGKQHNVLRSEIASMNSLGRSLMPEGFERDITPQQLADVIGLLQTKRLPPKIFPGNSPQVADVRDDGSVRLLAIYAKIYGPNLVFEEQYRNLGHWASAQDYAAWDVNVPQAGRYDVTLHFACDQATAGNDFELTIAGKSLQGTVSATGTWNDYTYQGIGTLELPAGPCEAVFRSRGEVTSYLIDLSTIILEPIGR